MNNISRFLPIVALVAILSSCTGTQYTSAYDDIYYSPSDDTAVNADAYVDIDDRAEDYYVDDYPKGREVDEYYDPEASYGYESDLTYDDYRARYEEDEYYYSTRFRRFHQPNYSFGYYDSFYSNAYWYSYDPFFWSPRVVRPYYYSPSWGYNWNNQYAWTASYTNGWFNAYPFSGYNGNYGSYGYNPYNYYGNSFCPPNGYNAYGGNDYYYNSTPVYNGQYNSLGSYSASSSTHLGKMLPANEPMYDIKPRETRPEDEYARPNNSTRPSEARPRDERPRDERPSEQESTRPREEYKPIDSSPQDNARPTESRPNREVKPQRERPSQNNRTVRPPTINRDGGSAAPSRNSSPSRSTGSGTKGGNRRN